MMRPILRLWAIVMLGLPLLTACGSAAPDLSVAQDSLTAAAGAAIARQQAAAPTQPALEELNQALNAAGGSALAQQTLKRLIEPRNGETDSALPAREAGTTGTANSKTFVPLWRQVYERYLETRQRIEPSGSAPPLVPR